MALGSLDLSKEEVRVLGCLLEKQRTTPDAYPLSLNALRLACNQSTNRDPVVDYDEATIRQALQRLERRGMTRLASGAGSRAAKHRHLLADVLPLQSDEQAVISVLMLRGPQTPGELKQRAERMHGFADLADVHATLRRLIDRQLAQRLERRPGQKEERYRQLLQEQGEEGSAPQAAVAADVRDEPPAEAPAQAAAGAAGEELVRLRERVARLERQVAELAAARPLQAARSGNGDAGEAVGEGFS